MAPRVIVFEAAANGEPSLAQVLVPHGCEVCQAATTESLADALASGRHHAVLFALCPDRSDDLVALRLLRHLVPEVPLIIVASDASLEVRRLIQNLRPIFFAARPVDGEELCEAIRAACEPARRECAAPAPRRIAS
jgi:DNA-binding NtrC family response regulator